MLAIKFSLKVYAFFSVCFVKKQMKSKLMIFNVLINYCKVPLIKKIENFGGTIKINLFLIFKKTV